MDSGTGRLVEFLDSRLRSGRIQIVDWAGQTATCGPREKPVVAAVEFKSRSAAARMLANPGLALGTGYVDEHWRLVEGNLVDLIATLRRDIPPAAPALRKAISHGRRALGGLNRAKSDPKNVDFHYNIGNDFYELWLDPDMFYSCAYFEDQSQSLQTAQRAKARRIAAKLNLKRGDRILDIGCGWGGMAVYLATNFDVHVTGLSLAERQIEHCAARAAECGLAHKMSFELCDYRSAQGSFDAIVSVGMLEHVGKASLPTLFKAVDRLLKPDGVALIHTIGSVGRNPTPNPWIERYIFPGGHIPSLCQIVSAIEGTSLIVSDVETLRMHYAWTLNAWRAKFMDEKATVVAMFGERFFRLWDLYLAISEASFRAGIYVNYQVQLTKQIDSLPFTRDYMNLPASKR